VSVKHLRRFKAFIRDGVPCLNLGVLASPIQACQIVTVRVKCRVIDVIVMSHRRLGRRRCVGREVLVDSPRVR
jgi:hypothetical protein